VTISYGQGSNHFQYTEQTPSDMCTGTSISQCDYGQLDD
jgi:hypothetical protein